MARRRRRPRSTVPVGYERIKLPRVNIIARIEAGFALRRDYRGDASIYERRGLVEVVADE